MCAALARAKSIIKHTGKKKELVPMEMAVLKNCWNNRKFSRIQLHNVMGLTDGSSSRFSYIAPMKHFKHLLNIAPNNLKATGEETKGRAAT